MIKLLQLMINKNCDLLTNVLTSHIADSQVGIMAVKKKGGVMQSTKGCAL